MTDAQRLARIETLLQKFRSAAQEEQIKLAPEKYPWFWNFPHGSCTAASFILGTLLKELEPEKDWHLVNGTEGGVFGHDWLNDGKIAVDATADQFAGYAPYVGISPPPLASKFHHKLQRYELSEIAPPMLDAMNEFRMLIDADQDYSWMK